MATRAEWGERVRRWKRSGLSAQEFGQAEGLKAQQLHWWSWKLGLLQATEREVPKFLPVRVVNASTTLPTGRPAELVSVLSTRGQAPIEVALPNGCAVRVAEGFDAETLARVLEVAAGIRP